MAERLDELKYDFNPYIFLLSYIEHTRDFILKTKCNCTYECAISYNILGNWRYQPQLGLSMFNLD